MTKKDFDKVADVVVHLTLGDVPIQEVLLNKEIPAEQIVEAYRVRTASFMAAKVMSGTKGFNWPKFMDTVRAKAIENIEERRSAK